MHNCTFLVWTAALSAGIGFSVFIETEPTLSVLALLLLLLSLVYTHRKEKQLPFFAVSCLCFFVVGYIRGSQGDVDLLPQSVYDYAGHVSLLVSERLHSLALSPEVTSLMDAVLVGQRWSMSHELRQLYADAGAAHVLALSGLHLSILFGVFDYWLMRVLPYAPVRCAFGVFGLVTMWVFALIVGLPISLVRASVMMSLFLLSQMRLTGNDGWHTLGLAAMLILFVSPGSLWNIGFQLSFAAMAGLFVFYQPIHDLWWVRRLYLYWLWCGVVASFSAQVLGMPLVVYYFGQVSLYTVFFSPFYVLLTTLILYSGLLALAFGSSVAFLVSFFVSAQHWLMHCASLLPGAVLGNLHTSLMQVVLQYMGIFCFVPVLRVMQGQYGDLPLQPLAYVLRRWPYIVAGALCFLLAYIV